jgi:threonyl-tRNA synthetase
VDHVAAAGSADPKRAVSRATKEHGARMENTGHIGGPFEIRANPQFLAEREAIFDRFWAENEAATAARPDDEITITLPDGTVKPGVAFKTTPYDVALSISKGLANAIIIAKVHYTRRLEGDVIVACDAEEDAPVAALAQEEGELWDVTRPLVGDCNLRLLKFEDPEGKTVRSAPHI